jgi:hypothetical protein
LRVGDIKEQTVKYYQVPVALLVSCGIAASALAQTTASTTEQTKAPRPRSVLGEITTFNAGEPPEGFVRGVLPCGEPWDCRDRYGDKFGVSNPPKVKAFAIDVCQLLVKEIEPAATTKSTSASDVQQVFGIYMQRSWTKLVGYRPWTHQSFIKSLSVADRARLAGELASYIQSELKTDDCQ